MGLVVALEAAFLLLSVAMMCSRAPAIGRMLDLFDHPDSSRKFHPAPTPLVGGVSTMLPLIAVAVAEAWREPDRAQFFLVLAASMSGFFLLGCWDDRRHVAASTRLLVSTLILTAALALEQRLVIPCLTFVDGPTYVLELGPLAAPFTLVCLLGFQNAVNMADGANGLVMGLSIGWLSLLLLYAPAGLDVFIALAIAALAVALPFNLRGRLFLGDSGAYAASVLTGLLIIYTYNTSERMLAATVMLWLIIPVLDCLRIITVRMRAGRSPFSADRLHLHHRLMEALPWPLATGLYLALALLPGLLAELLPGTTMLFVFSALLTYGLILRICPGDR